MSSKHANPGDPIESLAIGHVIEVDGTHVIADLDGSISELTRVYNGIIYPVGQYGSIVKIHFGRRVLYAHVSRLRMKSDFITERGMTSQVSDDARIVELDLLGEGQWQSNGESWSLNFERGVSAFPLPLQKVYLTPHDELVDIFGREGAQSIRIGEIVGSGGTPCFVNLDDLLCKHSAILGSTGSGKSCAVAAVVHQLLNHGHEKKFDSWNPSIIILDPHDEYSTCFPGTKKYSTDDGSMALPYWLLDFEETVALIIGKTEFAATSQTNILKNALYDARQEGAKLIDLNANEISVDSPIPYILGDPSGLDIFGKREGELEQNGLVGFINRQRPDNRSKAEHAEYSKIIRKIDSLVRDSRLQFMMKSWKNENQDPIASLISQFMSGEALVKIIDLSGVPNEVGGTATSVIARLLFNIKVWQTPEERTSSPVAIICEEAHRYVPNRGEAQYADARSAIQRLAKEGRKYGVSLVLVSQRPSELDQTVLSQCNSWLVLRITNDSDRDSVKAILPDSLQELSKVLSGLRRREAIVVGEAVSVPTRVRIVKLKENELPRSMDVSFSAGWQNPRLTNNALQETCNRWRYQKKDTETEQPSDSDVDAPF